MKKTITMVSALLLTLTLLCVKTTAQTQGMYDVPITINSFADEVFMGKNTIIHRHVNFIIPPFQIIPLEWELTPEIGATPLTASTFGGTSSIPLGYNYTSDGKKTVKIKWKDVNSAISQTQTFTLTVKTNSETYQSPDDIWTITTSKNFAPMCEAAAYPNSAPQKGFASVYIKYGAGHNGKLVRPIIFVDGIDFGTDKTYTDPNKNNQVIRHGATGWDVLTLGMDEGLLDPDLENGQPDYEAFREYPNAFRSLLATPTNGGESYDILFIDFSNGADYIQRNSLLLQELIRKVNQTKVSNAGIFYKNVVIGASMGGQVARHALASMEKNGENHCTHTYVSFDSPQKGANIPLSIQAMGWFFGATSDNPNAKDFWRILSTPAARQMLIDHFGSAAKNGNVSLSTTIWSTPLNTTIPEDYACLRTEFVTEMAQLEYPKTTRNIAIACGSTLGNALANQGYSQNSELFDMNFHANFPGNISFGEVGQIQLYARGSNNLNFSSRTGSYVVSKCGTNSNRVGFPLSATNVLFAGAIPSGLARFLLIAETPCKYVGVVVRNTNLSVPNMDHVQGCKRRDFPAIKRLFSEQAALSGLDFNLEEATYRRSFCFMPTMSALDLNWPMTQANLEKNIILAQVVDDKETPFSAVYAPTEQRDGGRNLKHVEISASMVQWLQAEMLTGETASNQGTTLPTTAGVNQRDFDKDGVIVSNYAVNSGGILSVNATGAKPSVTVAVNGSCSAARVDVNNGGQFNIGTSTAQGIVRVVTGGIVSINNGGTLKIEDHSQIVIETGGKLIIESGANINFANITLFGGESSIIIKNGGELIMGGQPTVTGNGHFRFEQGNIFTLNNNLLLTGASVRNALIIIALEATITVNNPFEWRIERAIIRHEGGVTAGSQRYIWLRNGATFRATDVTFENQDIPFFGPITGSFVVVEDPFDINNDPNDMDYSFDRCRFQDVGIAVELDVPYAQSNPYDYRNVNLEFQFCAFTNCQALKSDRSYITLFDNCILDNANMDVAHTYWLNLRNTSIRSIPDPNIAFGGGRGSGYGLKAAHVGHLWLREDCTIDNWETGIDDSEGAWNIIMTESTIQGCGTGILLNGVLQGTTEVGLLHMNCARLIENDAGIKGKDIIFSINARPGTTNVFTKNIDHPNGLFIESVFQDRQNTDTDLWFFGNYWNGSIPATTPVNAFWSFKVKTGAPQLPNIDWNGIIHIEALPSYPVRTDPNDPIVQSCRGILRRNAGEDPLAQRTIVNINGILYDVKIQRDAGMNSLNQNNLVAAQNLLNPVADIPNSIRDTASPAVNHFIAVSRALTLRNGVQSRSKSSSGWLPEAIVGIAKPQNMLVLSPNPANEQFDISLPRGDYDIQVFDALGKHVFSKNTEGVTTIDVRSWHNGIYIVNLLDKVSKKKTFSKVVVQH